MTWMPNSWKSKRISQIPRYPDEKALEDVEFQLSHYPPLVFAGEAKRLKTRLAQVCLGDAFLLHGGDCAESFDDLSTGTLRDNFRVLLQMAIVLTFTLKRHVVKVGRTAGQFAKPRSSDAEKQGDETLPSYRGDIINGFAFDKESRTADPKRMERAYFHSAATLNMLRGLAHGGFSNLEQIHAWNLDFAHQSPQGQRYASLSEKVQEALRFMRVLGISENNHSQLREIEFYTSHEALLLPYEQALTRPENDSESKRWFDLSAHFLWIGERTRSLDSAHVEFLRGVSNPIGLKCSSQMTADELMALIDLLNPKNEPGRLTIITRFGHQKIASSLPCLIQRVQSEGRHVVWCCDPMHGNTITVANGYKTRNFGEILSEAQQFLAIHKSEGSYAGGIHLEMTGRNVIECLGGGQEIQEEHLVGGGYETLCDPRLNAYQALELAFSLVGSP